MVVTSFSFPELDQSFNALVRATRVSPKPVINTQGTLGGVNYLNVFGEDPLQVEIQGIIAGSACGQAGQVAGGRPDVVELLGDPDDQALDAGGKTHERNSSGSEDQDSQRLLITRRRGGVAEAERPPLVLCPWVASSGSKG